MLFVGAAHSGRSLRLSERLCTFESSVPVSCDGDSMKQRLFEAGLTHLWDSVYLGLYLLGFVLLRAVSCTPTCVHSPSSTKMASQEVQRSAQVLESSGFVSKSCGLSPAVLLVLISVVG